MTHKLGFLIAATTLVLAASGTAVGATAAHPHSHSYFLAGSTGAEAVLAHDDPEFSIDLSGSATAVGVCYDVLPGLAGSIIPPPTVVRDQDPDVGVGGGCFPFTTAYGSDVGRTVTVYVSESAPFVQPSWVACVDVDGDGVCLQGGADSINVCSTGGAYSGSVSETFGGACTMYLDPAAASQNLFVVFLTKATAGVDGVAAQTAAWGSISLL